MEFKEHNNRKEAKKVAEYITGQNLRLYMADKVKKYLGDEPLIIFDGAIGSGQLEQYINLSMLYGIDIQEKSVIAAKENYKNSDIEIGSFFNYNKDILVDAVVMNSPFSLKFKELSIEEQENITKEFPWKKSGVVDDIFVLKSLKYTKRYGFYILFPGVSYRNSEAKFREIIGNNLQELNMIENAFDDTTIPVIFVVIDREKKTPEVHKEVYDCKQSKVLIEIVENLETHLKWACAVVPREVEVIDIDKVNREAHEHFLKHVRNSLEIDLLMIENFQSNINFSKLLKDLKEIIKNAERRYENLKNENKIKISKQYSLFE